MQRAIGIFVTSLVLAGAWPTTAHAQLPASCKVASVSPVPERIPAPPNAPPNTPDRFVAIAKAVPGYVQIVCDNAQLFAREVEVDQAHDLFKAVGDVVFIEGAQRITADRLEFNTKTKLGTFWNAQGIMSITGKADPKSMFGSTEADAYFYGEKLEKIGPEKYRLINGTFTTCVQPTPRWDLSASNIVLVKDKRAVMRGAVLRIKNVPILYLPWMYYPINKGDRATGFLMPGYGRSTVRGQIFSNAFFWAISRSQDATFNYDYTSKAGSGYGVEYRYVQSPGSQGNAKFSVLSGSSSNAETVFKTRSYLADAAIVQQLGAQWQLRSNVNYTNNIQSQQYSQQDIYRSSNPTRSAAANLTGNVGRLRVSGEAGITDIFGSDGKAVRYGTLPNVRAELPSSPIGKSRVYAGVSGDFSALVRQNEVGNPATDHGLMRVDVNPTVRAPIGSLPYLRVTANAGMRFTYWSEQLNSSGVQVQTPLRRQLFDAGATITGPTFSRIFDTPNSGYATRWKHVIEPSVSVSKTTAFADFGKVPLNDGVDSLVGGVTNITYGLSNSLLAKRPTAGGASAANEIASVQIRQTYYSNAAAASYDPQYQTSLGASSISKWSPMSISARVQPASVFNVQAQADYDTTHKAIRSTSIGGGVQSTLATFNASWAKQFLVKGLAGFDNPDTLYHSLNTSASLRTHDNGLGVNWSWSYDFQQKQQLQQRFVAHYSSQCCGIAAEFQTRYLGLSTIKQDHIFNLSFSLAGIGTFSNLLGSFGR